MCVCVGVGGAGKGRGRGTAESGTPLSDRQTVSPRGPGWSRPVSPGDPRTLEDARCCEKGDWAVPQAHRRGRAFTLLCKDGYRCCARRHDVRDLGN